MVDGHHRIDAVEILVVAKARSRSSRPAARDAASPSATREIARDTAGGRPADSRGSSRPGTAWRRRSRRRLRSARPRLRSRPKSGGISIASLISPLLQAPLEIGDSRQAAASRRNSASRGIPRDRRGSRGVWSRSSTAKERLSTSVVMPKPKTSIRKAVPSSAKPSRTGSRHSSRPRGSCRRAGAAG